MSTHTTLDHILRSLGRIEGKLETFDTQASQAIDRMNRIDDDIERISDKIEKHHTRLSERVRFLEKRQYGIFLVAGIFSGLIGYFSKFFN